MEIFNTACPRNCYSTCSIKVVVEDGIIRRIEPHSANKSTSEGPCLKGLSYLERVYSKDRILFPLQKLNGEFIRISWDEAFRIITNRIEEFKERWGSHSILYYSASGMSGLLNSIGNNFWKLFGGVTTTYGNLCWPAGLEATRLTMGEVKHNITWDIENANLIVLWGKNPVETNIHQMVSIEKAQKNGAKLLVIDPRRTPSSDRADILIQPVPGTDGLLALAVAKIIIENELHNKEFINNYVIGFEEYSNSLLDVDIDSVSSTCGVPVGLITKTATIIGNTSPMTLVPGYGMQRYSNGGQTVRCLLALSIITGNIGKKGACWHYANLQSYIFDDLKEPQSYYPNQDDEPHRRSIPTALLGSKMLSTINPKLKMAWVERGNPLAQNPDTNIILKAFKQLDFIVVIEQFMTDTAREADIILPAKSMFEQSDIIGSYWNPYVQLKQKVIEPPGEVMPETEIYHHLANKLGFSKDDISKNIPAPTDEAIEEWLNKYISKHDELSLDKLKDEPIIAHETEVIAFSDLKFNTPSGKLELLSETASNLWGISQLPTFDILKKVHSKHKTRFPLCMISPNTKNRIHSQFGNLSCISTLDSEQKVFVNPQDAEMRNIKIGDRVRIYNEKGELVCKAKFDFSLRPGNITIYNGYWNIEGGSPNLLTKGCETDMGHGTAFHDTMVDIEKFNAE